MDISIAIVEDERIISNQLKHYINLWSDNSLHHVTVYQYETAETFIFDNKNTQGYDGVFLDIHLSSNGDNGLELAKQIRNEDVAIPIAFVTSFESYVFKGYDFNAIAYILKPIQKDRIHNCMNQIAAYASTNNCGKFFVKYRGSFMKIPYRSILYIQMNSHYATAHTARGEYEFAKKISELEEELPDYFCRCHRSIIINVLCVEKLKNRTLFLSNGEQLSVSKPYIRQMQEQICKRFDLLL